MDRLITDISNASRLDAELARETREAIDLGKLIKDVVAIYGETAKAEEARVSFNEPLQPAYVLGNPSALGQVFRNLIDNARSFSPPEGEVRVRLEPATARTGLTRIVVEDDGPGIPPDNLESIFKRFYTKRPAGSAFGKNSGLGLAISRQIVNSHGGRIFAENRLADPNFSDSARLGAKFTVELPGN